MSNRRHVAEKPMQMIDYEETFNISYWRTTQNAVNGVSFGFRKTLQAATTGSGCSTPDLR